MREEIRMRNRRKRKRLLHLKQQEKLEILELNPLGRRIRKYQIPRLRKLKLNLPRRRLRPLKSSRNEEESTDSSL